jgi:hypothetical protein
MKLRRVLAVTLLSVVAGTLASSAGGAGRLTGATNRLQETIYGSSKATAGETTKNLVIVRNRSGSRAKATLWLLPNTTGIATLKSVPALKRVHVKGELRFRRAINVRAHAKLKLALSIVYKDQGGAYGSGYAVMITGRGENSQQNYRQKRVTVSPSG